MKPQLRSKGLVFFSSLFIERFYEDEGLQLFCISAFLSPLADVAIGGLLVGTLLTLIFVPMYAYMADNKFEQAGSSSIQKDSQ